MVWHGPGWSDVFCLALQPMTLLANSKHSVEENMNRKVLLKNKRTENNEQASVSVSLIL